jgi:uncharacterized membrane protein YhaH (DUF805 family)/ribosomal protein L37AE/L43A
MNPNIDDRSPAGLSLQPQAIVCPKCQYKRTAADQGPGWQCPSCGVAYSKATASAAAVTLKVNSTRGAGGSRQIDPDELETVTPGALSLSISGRIGRLRYLAYSWPMMVLSGLGILAAVIPKTPGMVKAREMMLIPGVILLILWFYNALRLMALRLHDVNRSAKWVLALLLLPGACFLVGGQQMVPVGTAIFWIIAFLLIVLPGSEGYNDYGPPAGSNTTLVKVGAGIVLALMALGVFANIKYMQYVRSGKLNSSLSSAQAATEEQPGSGSVQSPKEKALAELRKAVQEISPTLPKKIDRVTTLTEVEVSGDTYKVYYSMDPSVQLDAGRKALVEQAAKQQICRSSMKSVTDNGISVEYLYTFSGSRGQETLFVVVPAGSCN